MPTHPSQDDPRTFARMAVKGLTGEQFFDSLARPPAMEVAQRRLRPRSEPPCARSSSTSSPPGQAERAGDVDPAGADADERQIHQRRDQAGEKPTLTAICEMPLATTEQRIESLYLIDAEPQADRGGAEELVSYVDEERHRRKRNGRLSRCLLGAAEQCGVSAESLTENLNHG